MPLDAPATLYWWAGRLSWTTRSRIGSDPSVRHPEAYVFAQAAEVGEIDNGTSIRVVRGVPLEEIREEVHRASALVQERLDREVIGLTGPWCYYRGLRDRPDILEVLWDEGIRFTRTDGRNAQDWHPVSMDLQPYWYSHQGFPDMLEIPAHGWHDCVIRQDVLGWDDVDGYVASLVPYIDRAAEREEVFSLVQHDWSSVRSDPGLRGVTETLRYAQGKGLRIMTALDYYQERVRDRTHDRETARSESRYRASTAAHEHRDTPAHAPGCRSKGEVKWERVTRRWVEPVRHGQHPSSDAPLCRGEGEREHVPPSRSGM